MRESGLRARGALEEPPTLVVGAVPWELLPIEDELTDPEEGEVQGIAYTRGRVHDLPVVLGLTGVGKTNTGLVLGVLCNEFEPRRLLFSGTGARVRTDIKPGYIIVASEVFFHDAGDLLADGMHLRPIYGPGEGRVTEPLMRPDPELLAVALRAAEGYEPAELVDVDGQTYPTRVRAGRVATGDVFSINEWKLDEIRDRFDADLLEMEGASVAQAGQILGIPWLLIRSGSDRARPGNAAPDYLKYGPIAARQAALFTLRVIEHLARDETGGVQR